MDMRAGETYSQQEVTAIIRRALLMHDLADAVSHEDLEEIAHQTGISRERLQRAILEEQRERELERVKKQLVAGKRQRFHAHLRAYVIVNTGWFLINLLTVLAGELVAHIGLIAVMLPAVCWGMGLALHASSVFFANDERLEKEARKFLLRDQCKRTAFKWGAKAIRAMQAHGIQVGRKSDTSNASARHSSGAQERWGSSMARAPVSELASKCF